MGIDCRRGFSHLFWMAGILFLSSTTLAASSTTVQPDYASIGEFITHQLEAEAIPGAAVAFISDHQIVHEQGFGVAGRSGIAMDAFTPIALGSLTKSFTAIAIMQLVEEGSVHLDTPIKTYLYEFESTTDERMAAISVRHLLQHRSGFSTYDGNVGQADYSQRQDALDRAAARLAGVQLATAPGSQFKYSNANYQLLGLILERIDALPFETVVQQRILDVLSMDASFVRSNAADNPDPADGHRFWGHVAVYFDKPTPRAIVAQGGVYASAHDVALYLLDLMSPRPRLLTEASRDQLFEVSDKSADRPYGFGWTVQQYQTYREIFHGGANPGFETLSGFVPEQGSGYVILMNAGTGFISGNVRGTLSKVREMAMARDTELGALPASNKWIALALSGVLAGLLYLALRWIRQLASSADGWVRDPRVPYHWAWVSLVVALLGGLAFSLLIVVPKSFGIPLRGLIAFVPDIGWLLLAVGVSAAFCCVVRIVVFLRQLWSRPQTPVTR